VQTIGNVRVTAVHDVADSYFVGATSAPTRRPCSCEARVALTVPAWTNSHSDNDAALYNSITGGTSDDTHPSHVYGFACCASRRPLDLSCPVARTSGVCAIHVNNVANASFADCAARSGDLCSIAQSAVLRTAGALTIPVWTNSHSDNDGTNASVGVGAMPDNPNLTTNAGYACCLN
jgi:hypothetical protein